MINGNGKRVKKTNVAKTLSNQTPPPSQMVQAMPKHRRNKQNILQPRFLHVLWSSAAPTSRPRARPRPRFRVRKHLEKHGKNNAQDKENIQKTQSWAESPPLAAPCHKKIPKRYQKQPRRAKGTQKGDKENQRHPKATSKHGRREPMTSQRDPKGRQEEAKGIPKGNEGSQKHVKGRQREKERQEGRAGKGVISTNSRSTAKRRFTCIDIGWYSQKLDFGNCMADGMLSEDARIMLPQGATFEKSVFFQANTVCVDAQFTGCRLCRRPPKLEEYKYKFVIF